MKRLVCKCVYNVIRGGHHQPVLFSVPSFGAVKTGIGLYDCYTVLGVHLKDSFLCHTYGVENFLTRLACSFWQSALLLQTSLVLVSACAQGDGRVRALENDFAFLQSFFADKLFYI